MRKQPRDTNNPANPLMKVAALTLNRSRLQIGDKGKFQVDASLNFKRSDDLRGQAKGKDGREITVTFGLELTRAVLEMRVLLSDGERVPGAKISRVPFVQGLTHERRIEVTEERAVSHGINGKIDVKVKLLDPYSSDVSLGGGGHAELGSSRKVASTAAFGSLSVNATHTNDAAHWEITPSVGEEGATGRYLVGEVFLSASGKKKVPAAAFKWDRLKTKESVDVTGSVSIDIGDMRVTGVKFTDEDGIAVNWRSVVVEAGLRSVVPDVMANTEQLKERIVRQIIRKHLVEQGMNNRGSQLEICAARG